MKKVIVSTFSNTVDNYGQVLQYLATQVFLEQIGCDASLLRKSSSTSMKRRLKALAKKLKSCFLNESIDSVHVQEDKTEEDIRNNFFVQAKLITERKERQSPRYFEKFRRRWFKIVYCEDLKGNPPVADVYCIGSDQYWSWCSDENFLNYGPQYVKRISMATSFGAYNPADEAEWGKLRERLARFDLITVREVSGLEICKKAGRSDALLLPDPTLLLDAGDYCKYEKKNMSLSADYVFVYLLGNPSDVDMMQIYDFAKREKLNVVYVTSQGREDNFDQTPATVPEWLTYIKHAKYVMTNSFHGAAFSIIYHKQFLVFSLVKPFTKMNDRIQTLLGEHGLSDRLFRGLYDDVKHDINYGQSERYLSEKREMLTKRLKEIIYGQ